MPGEEGETGQQRKEGEEDDIISKTMNQDQEQENNVGEEENNDDAMDDDEREGFIRIRSQTDGIFEQEDDDDEDDEFYDFQIPEVEYASPPSRKRKQEISFIDNELTEIIEVADEPDYVDHETEYALDPELFPQRKRDRMPLYLLNPDDYGHDPKKQIQIRRAIITYRHHQDKKEQIIKLTEENKTLREYTEALKVKILELSRCGCVTNETADLEILDVVIPEVPPRMYVRNNKAVLAVPYNKCTMSPTSFVKSSSEVVKNEYDATSFRLPTSAQSTKPTPLTVAKPTVEVPKPLINITSSRLANLNSKTLNSNNVVTPTLPKPLMNRIPNGVASSSHIRMLTRPTTAQNTVQMGPGSTNRFSITGIPASKAGFIPISLAANASVKTEPGVSTSSIMHLNNTSKVPSTTTSQIPMTATVKEEGTTPATSTPVSRIVFARKGINTNTVQTASQLLFGKKPVPQASSVTGKPPSQLNLAPLTASQLTLVSRGQRSATVTNNSVTRPPNSNNQIFKTASGQVLRLVPPAMARKVVSATSLPHYPPIAPKPPMRASAPVFQAVAPKLASGSAVSGSEAETLRRREIEKQRMIEMWEKLDNQGDDEMEIIAALTKSSLPQRTRKQAMRQASKLEEEKLKRHSNSAYKSIEHIELNKYQDIVFEEAD